MSSRAPILAFMILVISAFVTVAIPSQSEACNPKKGHKAHFSKSKKKIKYAKAKAVKKSRKSFSRSATPDAFEYSENPHVIENDIEADLSASNNSTSKSPKQYNVDAIEYFNQQQKVE